MRRTEMDAVLNKLKREASDALARLRCDVHCATVKNVLADFYLSGLLLDPIRDSLGGNSKSAMLATISPSSLHLDETLATLRYACQARSIVNRVRRNEDPNERIIRDLRNEVEKIAALREELEKMKKVAENSTPVGDTDKQAEIDCLRQQLKYAEDHVAQNQLSWSEKLKAAEERRLAELEQLRRCGVAVELNFDPSLPYLVNLSADPILSGTLLYLLPPGKVSVGRAENCHIIVRGPLVQPKHCEIENEGGKLLLRPVDGAESFVNGRAVTEEVEMAHNDRLAIGGVHFFRIQCGGGAPSGDFDFARNELALAEERRLRAELNVALRDAATRETAYAEQIKQLMANLDDPSEVSQPSSPHSPTVSPFRSTFLQELTALLKPTEKDDEIGLHDLDLIVKEANHRCADLGIALDFQHEQVVGENGLQAAIKIVEKQSSKSSNWRPTTFLRFLNELREVETKEEAIQYIERQQIEWENDEDSSNVSRKDRRISLRTRALPRQDSTSWNSSRTALKDVQSLPNDVAKSLTEMQRLQNIVAATCLENPDLKVKFDEALPFFRKFISTFLQSSNETNNKTVRFTTNT